VARFLHKYDAKGYAQSLLGDAKTSCSTVEQIDRPSVEMLPNDRNYFIQRNCILFPKCSRNP
jgi:hypothetical protein